VAVQWTHNNAVERRTRWWVERGFDHYTAMQQAAHETRRAVVRARESGAKFTTLGKSMGLSRGRVQQYCAKGLLEQKHNSEGPMLLHFQRGGPTNASEYQMLKLFVRLLDGEIVYENISVRDEEPPIIEPAWSQLVEFLNMLNMKAELLAKEKEKTAFKNKRDNLQYELTLLQAAVTDAKNREEKWRQKNVECEEELVKLNNRLWLSRRRRHRSFI
jgi:hypothetical protein